MNRVKAAGGIYLYKYKFTVFTPCYNSAHTIYRVIDSLQKQTFKDFEWILVNDGSTDKLYETLFTHPGIADNLFPVKYFSVPENRGKPAAINLGLSKAEGEFFLIGDADDAFTADTLDVLYNTYQKIPEGIKNEIAGVYVHCRDQFGNFIGDLYPLKDDDPLNDPLIDDYFNVFFNHKTDGEKWGFIKTDIMKEFPFNDQVDKFVPETHVWYAIANKYKFAFTNRILRIYYSNENNNCLTITGKRKHPAGFAFYYREIINKYLKKMRLPLTDTIRLYKNMIKFSLYADIDVFKSIKQLRGTRKKIFALLCVPLGYLAVYFDKRKGQNIPEHP
jgi:glycosyltransferase involved in cell wall biosynthesis